MKTNLLLIISFFILCLSCTNKSDEQSISENTIRAINQLKWLDGVNDHEFAVCNEGQGVNLDILMDSLDKNLLLDLLIDTSSHYGFKYYLFERTYQKYPELRTELLSIIDNDSTTIEHVTGCFGIVYVTSFEEDCFLIAARYDTDSIGQFILNNKPYFECVPEIFTQLSSCKENYTTIKSHIFNYPEALYAYTNYFNHDWDLVDSVILEKAKIKDTTFLCNSSRILLNRSISSNEPSKHIEFYSKLIVNYDLSNSQRFKSSIPKIVHNYLEGVGDPYPNLENIIKNEISICKDQNELCSESVLNGIYGAFFYSLNYKHYLYHSKEIQEIEDYFNKKNIEIDPSMTFMNFPPKFGR